MQSTATQMITRELQSVGRGKTGAVSGKKDTAEITDPFLQIIMSLLMQSLDLNTQQTGTSENLGASDESARLIELSALLGNSAAVISALLNLSAGGVSDVSDTGDTAASAMSGVSAKAQAADARVPVSFVSDEAVNAMNLTQILSLFGKSESSAETVAISSDALAQLTDLLGVSSSGEMKSMLKNAGIEVLSGESQPAQDGFAGAVAKAKQLPSEYLSQNTDEQDDIDVDLAGNEPAKTETATPFELKLKSAGAASDESVLQQLSDGIKQNISLGKSEFTIKLKPETLGEITVKLVEEAGKMTLTISAASAQTAKLINSDIAALKEAVAPMNVEVREAVVSTNETASGSMQQFEMSGQQFAEQQFAGQQNLFRMSQTASGHSSAQPTEDNSVSLQAARMKAYSGDRLDAYI